MVPRVCLLPACMCNRRDERMVYWKMYIGHVCVCRPEIPVLFDTLILVEAVTTQPCVNVTVTQARPTMPCVCC